MLLDKLFYLDIDYNKKAPKLKPLNRSDPDP